MLSESWFIHIVYTHLKHTHTKHTTHVFLPFAYFRTILPNSNARRRLTDASFLLCASVLFTHEDAGAFGSNGDHNSVWNVFILVYSFTLVGRAVEFYYWLAENRGLVSGWWITQPGCGEGDGEVSVTKLMLWLITAQEVWREGTKQQ